MSDDDDLLLRSLSTNGGNLDIELEAGGPNSEQALLLISDACGQMLDDNAATNYVEFTVSKRERPTYIVLVRRYAKPTPHDLRRAAEDERDAAREEVAVLERENDAIRAQRTEEVHAWHQDQDRIARALDVLDQDLTRADIRFHVRAILTGTEVSS